MLRARSRPYSGLDLVKRAELSAEPTHDPIAVPGFYPPSGTGTLLPSGAASTPGTQRGSVDSGLGSDAASCRSERSEGSVWSGDSGLATFSPQFTLLSRFPTTTRADFIHRSRPLGMAGGNREGGGQGKHSCSACGMSFPYPSKLRYVLSPFLRKKREKGKKQKLGLEKVGLLAIVLTRPPSDHMHVHNNDKSFACPTCSSRFRRKRELTAHYKTHKKKMENIRHEDQEGAKSRPLEYPETPDLHKQPGEYTGGQGWSAVKELASARPDKSSPRPRLRYPEKES